MVAQHAPVMGQTLPSTVRAMGMLGRRGADCGPHPGVDRSPTPASRNQAADEPRKPLQGASAPPRVSSASATEDGLALVRARQWEPEPTTALESASG